MPFSAPSNLQQGDRATLTCTVARGDSPLTLMWMKDGEPIPMGESTYKVLNFDEFNSMLTLESLNLEHIGNYSCRASNPAGSSSVETQLIVYGKQITSKQRFWRLFSLSFSPTRISALQFRHDFFFSVLYCTARGHPHKGTLRACPRGHAGQLQLAEKRKPLAADPRNLVCDHLKPSSGDHHYSRRLFQPSDYFQTRTRPRRQLHMLGL